MKSVFFALSALVLCTSSFSFADQAQDLQKVRHLANLRISGSDVRKSISVSKADPNDPCAPEGISYVVKVQIRSSQMKMVDGNATQEREWQDFNTYYIAKSDLDKGLGLNDTLCQE